MGQITFQITGGTPNYHVELIPDIGTSWPYGSAGIKTIYDIPAGDYAIRITDSNGCVTTSKGDIVIEGTTITTEEPETTTSSTITSTTETSTTTTECQRPDGLTEGRFVNACSNVGDPEWQFGQVSVEEACSAWNYYRDGSGGTINHYGLEYTSPLNIGDKVYWHNGTMDCFPFYDGFYWFQPNVDVSVVTYFRNPLLTEIYVATIVDSTITDINICYFGISTTETTTTSTSSP